MQNPISKRTVDYSKSEEFKFRTELLEELKRKRKVALRLGELRDNKNWVIHAKKVKELLAGKIEIKDLQPEDVTVDIRQKGIDMKIGVDIASLAFSNTAAIQAVSNLAKSANGARVGFELTK